MGGMKAPSVGLDEVKTSELKPQCVVCLLLHFAEVGQTVWHSWDRQTR